MAIFENPNSPAQPKAGVYVWYAQKDGEKPITIYVGKAGDKKSLLPTGTLFRGVGELHRVPLTSNGRRGQRQSREARRMVFLPRNGWADLCGELGRAMPGGLKKIVRNVGFDAREVLFKSGEIDTGIRVWLWGWVREKFEFRPVHLEAIHLLMMKGMRADDGVG